VPREWWDRVVRIDASSNEGRLVFLVLIMAITTVIAGVEALLMMSWAPLMAAGLGWLVIALYGLLQGTALEKAGGAVGSITAPSGDSTPSVAQHSNIETLSIRGQYAEAAEAYRAVIAADPADLVACEKLGQLALRELKDYPLAVFAYREAERRAPNANRAFGYALLAAGIYRDNLNDAGKAMVELRRILERYPDAPNAARLRTELEQLKAAHFEAP
jgi:tetratricopeptide (TPR) repeat protein